jgi:hypothetical protein
MRVGDAANWFHFTGTRAGRAKSLGRTNMAKLNVLAAVGSAFVLAFVGTTGIAAPLSLGADATMSAAAQVSLIEQTHGTHRACVVGRVPRWGGAIRFHRHVGRNNAPVRC